VVEAKLGRRGIRPQASESAWTDGDQVTAAIPGVSQTAIDATIAYCEYCFARYGRFPVTMSPFRTVLRFQAGHLDPEFYRRYYRPDVLPEPVLRHDEVWHDGTTS